METEVLYYVGAFVLGLLAGIIAAKADADKIVKNLNKGINELRKGNYTPRENAHWALEQYKDHIKPIIEETKKPEEKKSDSDDDDAEE